MIILTSFQIFQVLTKRAERILEIQDKIEWAPNIWLGVTVENERALWRIDYLKKSKAIIKFLSLEPLLGPLPNFVFYSHKWGVCELKSKYSFISFKWISPYYILV